MRKYKNIILSLFFILSWSNKTIWAQNTKNKYSSVDTIKDTIQTTTDSLVLINSFEGDTTKKLLEAKIKYNAKDSIIIMMDEEKMLLFNESTIDYSTMKLKAHHIEIDMKNERILAKGITDTAKNETGLPVFVDKNDKYESHVILYNYRTKKAYIENILTEEEEGFVHGEKTKRIDENTYYLKNGRYTTCDKPDDPHYYIRLKKAKLIKDKAVFAKGFGLVIEDATTAYLPFPAYFPFSKKYSSGIVMPTYGEEERRGFFFRDFGIYIAEFDYFDFLLTFDIFTNGSWGIKERTNYRKRYKFTGNIDIQYYKNKFGDKGSDDYIETTDFSIRWTYRQDPKAHPYRTFNVSVDMSTASNDYNNSRSLTNIVNNKKHSSISYTRRWPNNPFTLGITMRHSQNSRDSTISLSIPDLSLNMITIYPFRPKNRIGKLKWTDKISLGYNASLRNSIHTHEDDLFGSSLHKDWRNGFQHRIPIGGNFKLFRDVTLSPSINYSGVMYINSIRKSWDSTNRRVIIDTLTGFNYGHSLTATTSLAYTPRIYGTYIFKEQSKIKAIRHVMSPSLSINYSPKIELGRNHYYRTFLNTTTNQEVEYSIFEQGIYGTPSGGSESASVNFSLDNSLEMKIVKKDTAELQKVKILESFMLSTNYNLLADSMNLSLIRLSGRTSLFRQKIRVNFGGDLDPYSINNRGNRIDKFHSFPGRLTSFHLSLSTQFSGKSNSNKEKQKDVERIDDYSSYVDFDIPWNLNINYNLRYTKPGLISSTTQNLRLTRI